jgi:hypothetical protein
MQARGSGEDGLFTMLLFFGDLNTPAERPLKEYPIKKGEPTLQGTKVTGICPK